MTRVASVGTRDPNKKDRATGLSSRVAGSPVAVCKNELKVPKLCWVRSGSLLVRPLTVALRRSLVEIFPSGMSEKPV
jgi:hypothetical protein